MRRPRAIIATWLAMGLLLSPLPRARAEIPNIKKPAKGRHAMIFKPYIPYPAEAKRAGFGGSGILVLIVDSDTGRVTAGHVVKTTGHEILDRAALQAFLRARFTKGTPERITVPFYFNPNF